MSEWNKILLEMFHRDLISVDALMKNCGKYDNDDPPSLQDCIDALNEAFEPDSGEFGLGGDWWK